MSLPTAIAFLVLAIVAGCAVLAFTSVLSALRDRHPATWEQLGKPHQWNADMRPKAWTAVYAFLWSGRYKQLNDPTLHDQVTKAKLAALAMFVAGVVAHAALAFL